MKSETKNSLKKLGFSKTEMESLLFPLQRLIITGRRDKSSEGYNTLVVVAHKLTWWLVLIGQEVRSINLDIVPEKRQALLVYKSLSLVWFDRLPLSNNEPFSLFVATRFPGFVRPEAILEAFNHSEETLLLECRETSFQEFTRENKVLKVSINSFPKMYPQP